MRLIIVFSLFLFSSTNGFSQDLPDDLIGFWQISKSIIRRGNKRRVERTPMLFEFKENGVFVMGQRGSKNSQKASWKLDDETLTLSLKGDDEVVKIIKCTSRKLILLDSRNTKLILKRI